MVCSVGRKGWVGVNSRFSMGRGGRSGFCNLIESRAVLGENLGFLILELCGYCFWGGAFIRIVICIRY